MSELALIGSPRLRTDSQQFFPIPGNLLRAFAQNIGIRIGKMLRCADEAPENGVDPFADLVRDGQARKDR
jgi:hypothetical protein